MKYSNQTYNLRIELDTKNLELNKRQVEDIEQSLDPVRDLVREFPVSSLYITITYHNNSETYRMKCALVLSGQTLATGDLAGDVPSATDRCVRKLVKRIEQYKQNLANAEEQEKFAKGTYHDVVPNREPEGDKLEAAVAKGDYATFRKETYMYEEPVRKRAGRWVQRYPDVNAVIGEKLMLADIVEEVFLTAFERYHERPDKVRLGEWLEQLIDPSLKLLIDNPSEEMQNISFARTLLEQS